MNIKCQEFYEWLPFDMVTFIKINYYEKRKKIPLAALERQLLNRRNIFFVCFSLKVIYNLNVPV